VSNLKIKFNPAALLGVTVVMQIGMNAANEFGAHITPGQNGVVTALSLATLTLVLHVLGINFPAEGAPPLPDTATVTAGAGVKVIPVTPLPPPLPFSPPTEAPPA
jgi:hypothetical protein